MINFNILLVTFCVFFMKFCSAEDELPVNDLNHCKEICFKNFVQESRKCAEIDECDDCLDDCNEKLGPFLLQIASTRSEGLLFSANITWDGSIMNIFKQCLVTWEISGGGLMGNLVTDSPTVELTLWADKLYNVQVSCKNKETNTVRTSYKLAVDTKLVTVIKLKPSLSKISGVYLNGNLENQEDLSLVNFVRYDPDDNSSNLDSNVIKKKLSNEILTDLYSRHILYSMIGSLFLFLTIVFACILLRSPKHGIIIEKENLIQKENQLSDPRTLHV